MHVFNVNDGNLEGLVDLYACTCSCIEYNCLKILSFHAIIVAAVRNINVQTLCAKWLMWTACLLCILNSVVK